MEAVYGEPPAALAAAGPGAAQVSPLVVGSRAIESLEDGSLSRLTVAAPPGTLERRFVLAHALRALAASGELIALAPKAKGGSRMAGELEAFGCAVHESARRHHRICQCVMPDAPIALQAAIDAGSLQWVASLGQWSQPGVFSWDRIDPGSALLMAQPWDVAGVGADLGCGVGVLARRVLASPAVTRLALIDIDRRAVDAARRNIDDTRASFLQHDLRHAPDGLSGLDFAVMNPPFHDGGAEDRKLGQAFVATVATMLRRGGALRLVANVALSYERVLAAHFTSVNQIARDGGYKVLEARR